MVKVLETQIVGEEVKYFLETQFHGYPLPFRTEPSSDILLKKL
ncbi:MAG: hypothetical protein ABIB79_02295 [archaeon]